MRNLSNESLKFAGERLNILTNLLEFPVKELEIHKQWCLRQSLKIDLDCY